MVNKTSDLKKEIHNFVLEYIKGNMDEQIFLEGNIKKLVEQALLSQKQEFVKVIDEMGTFRCGYMDSIEGCDRIDKEELKQKLGEMK